MTDTTKEIFENYEVRYSKKQKEDFRGFVNKVAVENGYECRIEQGASKSQNIIVGDVDNAKVIFTAHYDTPAQLPFPNFIMPKHMILATLILVVPCLLVFMGLVTLIEIMCNELFVLGCPDWLCYTIASVLEYGAVLLFLFFAYWGKANKHNSNDNTSGITTLLDIMTSLPKKDRKGVAFVFFDMEEKLLQGSSGFAKKHKDLKENAFVVNFDCVADGKKVLIVAKKAAKKYAEVLEKTFNSNELFTVEVATKGVVYPSDHIAFKHGVGIGVFPTTKKYKMEYTRHLHTKKDTIYQEENIAFLVDCAKNLVRELNKESSDK